MVGPYLYPYDAERRQFLRQLYDLRLIRIVVVIPNWHQINHLLMQFDGVLDI